MGLDIADTGRVGAVGRAHHHLAASCGQCGWNRKIEAVTDDRDGGLRRQTVVTAPVAQIGELRVVVDAQNFLGFAGGVIAQITAAADNEVGLDGELLEQAPVKRIGRLPGHDQPAARVGHGDPAIEAGDEIGINISLSAGCGRLSQVVRQVSSLERSRELRWRVQTHDRFVHGRGLTSIDVYCRGAAWFQQV